jgi:uncharacterized phage protein gp47/JayE
MSFVPRTKDQIRDAFLANLASRFAALTGDAIDIRKGSPMWMLGDAIGLEFSGVEAAQDLATKQLLPDLADTEFLERHGFVEGASRLDATASSLSVAVTGSPDGLKVIGSALLTDTNGLVYVPTTSTVTITGGNGALIATCQTPGTGGNLAATTVLQWSAAPTGLNPTALVSSITAAGTERETDQAYAARIIARRKDRPASFNRADVVELTKQFHSVAEAYVYPLLQPGTDTVGIPGCLQVVALGPIPKDANGVQNGDSVPNTRFLVGGEQADIEAYWEGTVDKEGIAVPLASQTQLRPVTLLQGNYRITQAIQQTQNVTMAVVVTAVNAKKWSGTMTTVAGGTTTSVVVSGDQSALVLPGMPMLVRLNSLYRGEYKMVTPTAPGVFDGVNTTFTVPAMEQAPTAATTVYPAPANWPQIRLAIFALFDRLTPGDAAAPSQRWPNDDVAGPSTLYPSELIAAVCAVPGVIDATVSVPAAAVVAVTKALIDLLILIVTSN